MRLWVEQLSEDDKDLWNEWVSSHPESHFYDLWEWGDVLSRTYNYQRFYFAVKSNEGVVGVFPLVHIRGRIFESKLVSLPFCEYGGPLLSNSSKPSTVDAASKLFLKVIRNLMSKLKTDYVEVRQPSVPLSTYGFFPIQRYLTFRVKLSDGEAQVWRNMNKKCRNAIRKSAKSGVKILTADKTHLKYYYSLYLDTEKRHGSPPHSEALFINIFDALKEKGLAQIMLAIYDGRAIGGVIAFCFNGKMYWWNNVTDRKYGSLNPTNSLLWHIIQWGARNSFTMFDLGRTRYETRGIYDFKNSWGGERCALEDYVLATKKVKLPDPFQRRYMYLSKMWSKLPFIVAQQMGPSIIKEIGL